MKDAKSKYPQGKNPKTLETLKKYQWTKGKSGNPKGRPLKFESQFKNQTPEIKDKIRERLHQALMCNDTAEAKAILEIDDGSLGEYGFILQIASRDLTEKGGISTLIAIYEILYGKIPATNLNIDVDDDSKKEAFIKGIFTP